MTNIFNTYDYLMHRKIKYNMDLVDFYNPTLIIVDSRVRDISEYYKSLFFVEDIEVADILEKINESIKRFNEEELILFMARMLYPTYFFDCYDRIIGYGEDEKIIYPIRDRALEYEKLLKEIYLGIKKATHIENIEWLSQ